MPAGLEKLVRDTFPGADIEEAFGTFSVYIASQDTAAVEATATKMAQTPGFDITVSVENTNGVIVVNVFKN